MSSSPYIALLVTGVFLFATGGHACSGQFPVEWNEACPESLAVYGATSWQLIGLFCMPEGNSRPCLAASLVLEYKSSRLLHPSSCSGSTVSNQGSRPEMRHALSALHPEPSQVDDSIRTIVLTI